MAGAQGAAAVKHTWWRGHFLWGEKVMVGHLLLEGVGVVVVVCVAVSVGWQHVSSLMAAEAGGGCWRGGLAEGERVARAA